MDPEDTASVVRAQWQELKLLQALNPKIPLRIKVIEGSWPPGSDYDLYGWKPFVNIWSKVKRPIYTRGILPNELLFDPDTPEWDTMRAGIEKLINYCKGNNIPFIPGFSGGKGVHVSIYFQNIVVDPELEKDIKDIDVDFYKTVRKALVLALAEKAGVDLEAIRIDWGKISFDCNSKGSQVRTFGTIRAPGLYKTLIEKIPDHKPKPYELPLVFPEKVELWDLTGTQFEEIVITALKAEVKRAKKANEHNIIDLDFSGTDIISFPCAKNLHEIGITNGRYYAGEGLLLLCKKCGIPKEEAEQHVRNLFKTFPGITQAETALRIQNALSIYDSGKHFSCRVLKEHFPNQNLCDFSNCPIKLKLEENNTTGPSGIEEITQEEINKIRTDRYSPRIPNLHGILDEHHLINVYCDWVSSLSDTYYEYQVGSVFWLLSALTEGKVCLRAKQEVIKPNFWAFFLGRSTTSRKSTAINKAKDIFTSATDCELFNDEFSLEGYLKLLSKYPVNNLVRDEAGGLLAKSYKKYNDGIFDIECLIYDGQDVRKTLAKEEVLIKSPFVTHLYGTTLDTFTSVMELRTVLGGYGFRFLYFAPDYIKPRKDIDLETEEDIEKWAEILTRVKKLKKFFNNSDVINFKVDPEAFKNYNQVVANLETTIDNIGDSMLNSALGRYQVYILKLAMLIEIGKPEPSFTIHNDSMSLAVSLVVDYFLPSYQDIIERLEEDIKFNQVEKVISTLRKLGNTAPRHKLLKNSKLKQKDFDEVTQTLVASKTISAKTITGTGGSDGEVFILEDVKLDLRSAINQNTSFPSFPSFPSFSYITHSYTNEVKEGKEEKTDIERAIIFDFTSEVGEIGETRERSEIRPDSLSEILSKKENSRQQFQSCVVSEEEAVRILEEEGI